MKDRDLIINIKKDQYTSECFGREVYTADIFVDKRHIRDNLEIARALIKKLRNLNDHPYVTCKHTLSDIPVIHGLEGAGFKLMSVDATFYMKPYPIHRNQYNVDNEIVIEEYCDKYDDAFSALIKNTPQFFADTHYYNSPYFDRRLCDLFYRRWILKDIGGRSNRNYLAIYENRIVGFSLCIEKDNEAIIDLIWVDEDMRGRGVGTLMIYKLFNDVKNKVVKVPTQITNSNAINLYIKTGFKIKDIYAAYHKYGGNR